METKEIKGNSLIMKDPETNAEIPVMKAYSESMPGKEIKGNKLIVRDAETNAEVPVVYIEEDKSSENTSLAWGNITGEIEDQKDLKEKFDLRVKNNLQNESAASTDYARVVMNGKLIDPGNIAKGTGALEQTTILYYVGSVTGWTGMNLLQILLNHKKIEATITMNASQSGTYFFESFDSATNIFTFIFNKGLPGQSTVTFKATPTDYTWMSGTISNVTSPPGNAIYIFLREYYKDWDTSQVFVQKKTWNSPAASGQIKLLGIDNYGNFVTYILSI